MSQVEWPDFDSDGADVDKLQNQPTVDKTGKYHMEIINVRENRDPVDDQGRERSPDIMIVSQVAESVKGQSPSGSIFFHTIRIGGKGGSPASEGARNATLSFLLGLGILVKKDEKVIDPSTNSTKVDVGTLADRIRAVKQWVADVKHTPEQTGDDGKTYPEKFELPFGRGAYLVADPLVANVQKNKSLLAGVSSAASFGRGAGTDGNGSAGSSAPVEPAAIPKDF